MDDSELWNPLFQHVFYCSGLCLYEFAITRMCEFVAFSQTLLIGKDPLDLLRLWGTTTLSSTTTTTMAIASGFPVFRIVSETVRNHSLSLSLSLSLHISLCISFHTLCIYYTHVGMPISYILYIYVFILPMKSYHIYLSFVPSIYSWLLKGIRKWVLKRIQVEAVAQRAIAAMDRAEEEATVRGTRGLDFQALMFVKGEVESCESCLLVQEIREIHDCIRFPFVPNLSQLFLFSVGPP